MTKESASLDRAGEFMWRNARLLERTIFAHAFLDGPADAVTVSVLSGRDPEGAVALQIIGKTRVCRRNAECYDPRVSADVNARFPLPMW